MSPGSESDVDSDACLGRTFAYSSWTSTRQFASSTSPCRSHSEGPLADTGSTSGRIPATLAPVDVRVAYCANHPPSRGPAEPQDSCGRLALRICSSTAGVWTMPSCRLAIRERPSTTVTVLPESICACPLRASGKCTSPCFSGTCLQPLLGLLLLHRAVHGIAVPPASSSVCISASQLITSRSAHPDYSADSERFSTCTWGLLNG